MLSAFDNERIADHDVRRRRPHARPYGRPSPCRPGAGGLAGDQVCTASMVRYPKSTKSQRKRLFTQPSFTKVFIELGSAEPVIQTYRTSRHPGSRARPGSAAASGPSSPCRSRGSGRAGLPPPCSGFRVVRLAVDRADVLHLSGLVGIRRHVFLGLVYPEDLAGVGRPAREPRPLAFPTIRSWHRRAARRTSSPCFPVRVAKRRAGALDLDI